MAETLTHLEHLLVLQESAFGKFSGELSITLMKMGRAHFDAKNYAKAEESFWRAVEILNKTYGERHANVIYCLEQLSEIAKAQSNYLQFERIRNQVTAIKAPSPQFSASPAVPKLSQAALATAPTTTQTKTVEMQKPFQRTGTPSSTPITALIIKSTGECVPLRGASLWIGSDKNVNDISLTDDPSVARSHAVIERINDQVWIRPCDSKQITLLNGSSVPAKTQLFHGDVVTLGKSQIQVG